MSKSIHGKRISREKALEGLGNPKEWEAEAKKIYADFQAKPKKVKKLPKRC